MVGWLNNPWVVGIVSSIVGALIVAIVSNWVLVMREHSRESGLEGSGSRSSSKSKTFWTSVIFGLVAAIPAYFIGIWIAGSASSGGDSEQLLESGVVLRDCKNCPTMMIVPSGSFSMGSHVREAGRYDNEGPIHPVTLPETLGVGVYEVTRGQFRYFVEDTRHDAGQACWTYEKRIWLERDGRNWRFPGYPQTDQHPVVCVNWHDAIRYVEWLSSKTRQRYRLLTESEWEYAARSGTKTTYYWGNSIDGAEQCRFANGADLQTALLWRAGCDDGHEFTAPVGSYLPNPFGLHDMLGNVWEWTQDCWSDDYSNAPADGSAHETRKCPLRVLRGGSRHVSAEGIRAAHRLRFDPLSRNQNTGFRVARWAKPVELALGDGHVGIEILTTTPVTGEQSGTTDDALYVTSVRNGDEFNCDTLTVEIDDIPTRSMRDASIREIVSILIGESKEENHGKLMAKLQCAGRLAKMPNSRDNKDEELARVIDANIRANRCGAARELADHLSNRDNKSAQKATVARECLGRD